MVKIIIEKRAVFPHSKPRKGWHYYRKNRFHLIQKPARVDIIIEKNHFPRIQNPARVEIIIEKIISPAFKTPEG